MSVNYNKNTDQIASMLRNAHNPQVSKIRKELLDAEFGFLKKHIQGKNVIIAGSGLGHDSFELAQYCKYITGIELVENFVAEANEFLKKTTHTNISFIQGDFLNLDYSDKYFDVAILNMGTIGNFDDKEIVIKSLSRVCKILYFGFWTPNEKDIQIRLQMYQEEKELRHILFEVEGTTIRDKISGLESNCTAIEEIQTIVQKIGSNVEFFPVFLSFIIAKVS